MLSTSIDQLSTYALPLFLGVLFLVIRWHLSASSQKTMKLPPSPPRWPVIGNIHQLMNGLIHHSFLSLSKRYGDSLMLLYMGSIPCVVVSSSVAAQEILKNNDMAFANRPYRRMYNKLTFNHKEITFAPYGEYWRQAKGVLTINMLSTKKVKSFEALREKMIAQSISKITECFLNSTPVNLSDLFSSLSNDVTCMVAFGRTYNEGEIGREFKRMLKELFESLGSIYFDDIIPQLSLLDRVRGLNAKVNRVGADMDRFFQGVIDETVSKMKNDPNHVADDGMEPFVRTLINIQKEGTHAMTGDADALKAILLDAYGGGTDTTSSLLEWTMAELLKNPDELEKVRDEIKNVLSGKKHIGDDDTEKMKYLKAVITEAARLHPPFPILPPRVAGQDVKAMGYDIPKGTRAFVNVYAIMRDPKVYDQPDTFLPERFLDSSVDFIRHNFELLTFGAGRRSCPGRQFSMAIIEKLIANLVYMFDWSLLPGVKPEELDMSECFGAASHKTQPLMAFGKPVQVV